MHGKKVHPSRDPVPLIIWLISLLFENHIKSAVLVTANIICYFQFQTDFQNLMWLPDNFIP
jgi:hypothetical protein